MDILVFTGALLASGIILNKKGHDDFSMRKLIETFLPNPFPYTDDDYTVEQKDDKYIFENEETVIDKFGKKRRRLYYKKNNGETGFYDPDRDVLVRTKLPTKSIRQTPPTNTLLQKGDTIYNQKIPNLMQELADKKYAKMKRNSEKKAVEHFSEPVTIKPYESESISQFATMPATNSQMIMSREIDHKVNQEQELGLPHFSSRSGAGINLQYNQTKFQNATASKPIKNDVTEIPLTAPNAVPVDYLNTIQDHSNRLKNTLHMMNGVNPNGQPQIEKPILMTEYRARYDIDKFNAQDRQPVSHNERTTNPSGTIFEKQRMDAPDNLAVKRLPETFVVNRDPVGNNPAPPATLLQTFFIDEAVKREHFSLDHTSVNNLLDTLGIKTNKKRDSLNRTITPPSLPKGVTLEKPIETRNNQNRDIHLEYNPSTYTHVDSHKVDGPTDEERMRVKTGMKVADPTFFHEDVSVNAKRLIPEQNLSSMERLQQENTAPHTLKETTILDGSRHGVIVSDHQEAGITKEGRHTANNYYRDRFTNRDININMMYNSDHTKGNISVHTEGLNNRNIEPTRKSGTDLIVNPLKHIVYEGQKSINLTGGLNTKETKEKIKESLNVLAGQSGQSQAHLQTNNYELGGGIRQPKNNVQAGSNRQFLYAI